MLLTFFETIEEVSAALPAESALGSVGRIVYGNIVFTAEADVCAAVDGHERAAAPLSADVAVACAHVLSHAFNDNLNSAT